MGWVPFFRDWHAAFGFAAVVCEALVPLALKHRLFQPGFELVATRTLASALRRLLWAWRWQITGGWRVEYVRQEKGPGLWRVDWVGEDALPEPSSSAAARLREIGVDLSDLEDEGE